MERKGPYSGRFCGPINLPSGQDGGLSARSLALGFAALVFVALGLMEPSLAIAHSEGYDGRGKPDVSHNVVPKYEPQSAFPLTGALESFPSLSGGPDEGAVNGGPGTHSLRLPLGVRRSLLLPNPLIYLDIWLFGGLILLVMAVVTVKYLLKWLRPDNRDPEEGLQPWEDPDYYYDDSKE